MTGIKRNKIILLLLFVITLLIISSCEKPECKSNSDCRLRTCYASKCDNNKCSYTMLRNCCGNKINETIENGKQGNQCTCPQDYGKCEGKPKLKVGPRSEDAVYVNYYCNTNSQCVLVVDKKDVTPQNFLDQINAGSFKASSIIKYNKPFDIKKDNFEFKISLDDVNNEVILPITITNLKIFYFSESLRAEQLIAEEVLKSPLANISLPVKLNITLNLDYKPQSIEEIGAFKYSIDYSYTKKINSEVVRSRFVSPQKPIFFITSG